MGSLGERALLFIVSIILMLTYGGLLPVFQEIKQVGLIPVGFIFQL